MHVDQANLVFEAKSVERHRSRFEFSDVSDLDLSDAAPSTSSCASASCTT